MGDARNEMADNARARAQVYGLLAAIFRAEPSETLVRELKASSLTDTLSEMGVSLGDEFREASACELAKELAVEYTRLFIGPGSHISPYESVFAAAGGGGGDLWGKATVKVKKFIETAGFDYRSEFTGLPDHISAELEFMHKMAETEARLWSDDETQRAAWCSKVQRKFIGEHLGTWLPKFCDEVIRAASLPFYSKLTVLTRDFVIYDKKNLDEPLNINGL